MSSPHRAAILGLVFILTGCHSEDEPAGGTSERWLAATDSVLLVEDEEFELGDPFGFAVDPATGDLFFTDRFADRILRFDSLGQPRATYGRPGGGPGEFRNASYVFVHDGAVFGVDGQRFLIWVFDRDRGGLEGEIRTRGVVSDAVFAGDSLLLAAPHWTDSTSIELIGADSSHHRFGPIPTPLRENPVYFGFNAATYLAPAGPGRFYLAFAGRNEVYVVGNGGAVDTLDVPRLVRRGVPDDIVERMRDAQSLKERGESHSEVLAIHTLEDGRLAVVHQDLYIEGNPPTVKVSADVYLTVLDPNTPEAEGDCIDLRIAVAKLARPRVAFQDDDLYLLDRRLVAGGMQSWVLRFPLRELSCH